MDEAKRYPLDFDALDKGDVIPVEEVERIAGVSYYHRDFQLKLLALSGQIERELHDRGRDVVTKSVKGAIHIQPDWDASGYCAQQVKRSLRAMVRGAARLALVDDSQFSADQKRMHEHRLNVAVGTVSAAKKGRREAILTTRNRPELPPSM